MSQDLRKQSNVLEKLLVAKFEYFILIQVHLRHVNNIPTVQSFSLEFPLTLRRNLICYHRLSVSGNFEIMHRGILINMPY